MASVDLVLTFRNVHNWIEPGYEQEMFNAFFAALKPGGVLGVVEHRAKDGASKRDMIRSGYVSEAYVIDLAQKAGFKLAASSEVNANPKDSKDHPRGVWTLPPTLRSGWLGGGDRERYLAIGESDRMTLKFVKP
jgi:predicted methyltransferase